MTPALQRHTISTRHTISSSAIRSRTGCLLRSTRSRLRPSHSHTARSRRSTTNLHQRRHHDMPSRHRHSTIRQPTTNSSASRVRLARSQAGCLLPDQLYGTRVLAVPSISNHRHIHRHLSTSPPSARHHHTRRLSRLNRLSRLRRRLPAAVRRSPPSATVPSSKSRPSSASMFPRHRHRQ